MNHSTSARWLPSWAKRWFVALAVIYGLYLVAGNLLLNTSLGHDVANRKPEKFVASWDRAWTLYPGHVHASDLRVAGHVRRTVWSAQADAVQGRVALLPLLARELRVPRITASGVTGGASLVDVERPPAPSRPGGWTLRFDRIVADGVRHAYFNEVVLLGKGQATAGFVKTLRGGPMEMLPSRVSFERGVAWRNGARLAWDTAIDGRFAIARHRREEAPGIRKLEKTDLDLTIDATTAGLSIETQSGPRPLTRITHGPGRLRARLGWQHGSVTPGSQLQMSVPVQNDLSGGLAASVAVFDFDATERDLHLVARLTPTRDSALHADADLRIRDTNVPLLDPASLVPRTSGHLASQWHFESLAWLSAFMPGKRLLSFDGAGSVVADLRLENGQLAPGSRIDVPHVAATAKVLGNRFEGDARASVQFERADADTLKARLEAVMAEFRVAPAETPSQPYVQGQDLRVDAETHGKTDDLAEHVHARLRFSDARVPDLRAYNRYLPQNTLQFVGGEGRLSGDLRFDREGNVGSGELKVAGQGVQISVAGLSLAGDVNIDSRLRRADVAEHRFNVDGSRVTLSRVRATGADESLGSDWWGDVSLDKARLDWDKPMTLDGTLQARMKDVGVLLAIYAQKKDLPGWVGKLVDAGEANARGRVQWRKDTLLLDPFAASNDRFDVQARLKVREKQPTGDLFARWGALSVGVELTGDKKHVHLVGARKWFDGRPGLDP